MGLNLSGAY